MNNKLIIYDDFFNENTIRHCQDALANPTLYHDDWEDYVLRFYWDNNVQNIIDFDDFCEYCTGEIGEGYDYSFICNVIDIIGYFGISEIPEEFHESIIDGYHYKITRDDYNAVIKRLFTPIEDKPEYKSWEYISDSEFENRLNQKECEELSN